MKKNNTKLISCNLCGNEKLLDKVVVSTPDRFEEYVLSNQHISYSPRRWLTCTNCQVALQDIPFDMRTGLEAIADNYYEIDFGNIDLKVRQLKILSLPNESSDNANRVARVIKLIEIFRPEWIIQKFLLKALDFGSGLGVFPIVFAKSAREKGINLEMHLVETDNRALKLLREIPEIILHEGLYKSKDHIKYHVIFMNKVLEHLSNPLDWISNLKLALIPEGLLYIEVPSINCLTLEPTSAELGSLHFNLYGYETMKHVARLTSSVLLACEEINDPSGKRTCYALFAKSGETA